MDVDGAWKPVPYAVFLLMLSPIAGPSFPVYAFPPFSVIWQCLGGNSTTGSIRSGVSTTVADSAFVPQVGQNDNFNSVGSTSGGFGVDLQEGFKASSTQESENGCLSCFRDDVRC